MEIKESFKRAIAGLFFIGGLLMIIVFIFTVGKDKGRSESKFQVSVLFRNVGGLEIGAPVRLDGVNVGNVASVDFLDKKVEGRRVDVRLNLYSRFRKQLAESTRFTIRTEGVLGEKLVEIYTIENQDHIDLSKPVIGEDPIDAGDVAEALVGAAQSFKKTAEELSKIDMVEMANVLQNSSEALLVTSEGLNSIMDELEDIAKKAKRLIDRIEQLVIEGDLFKVF